MALSPSFLFSPMWWVFSAWAVYDEYEEEEEEKKDDVAFAFAFAEVARAAATSPAYQ